MSISNSLSLNHFGTWNVKLNLDRFKTKNVHVYRSKRTGYVNVKVFIVTTSRRCKSTRRLVVNLIAILCFRLKNNEGKKTHLLTVNLGNWWYVNPNIQKKQSWRKHF